MTARRRPEWWEWELELTTHLMSRMEDRQFTETDLRTMLQHPGWIVRDFAPGRWRIGARLRGRSWAIIVEPDREFHRIVVITAWLLAE